MRPTESGFFSEKLFFHSSQKMKVYTKASKGKSAKVALLQLLSTGHSLSSEKVEILHSALHPWEQLIMA